MTATATATAGPVAPEIQLDAIRISNRNPRKHFDEEKLAELTESVRQLGVLQPILVRWRRHDPKSPLTPPWDLDEIPYELVAGERRLRAARAAGLEAIPAVVRNLSDLEAMEIMVCENLHRSDLHPMEEAEGYELLHREHGLSVDELAAKVGKSKAYVYARMKLCALCKDARDAFFADRMTAGHAVILARLHSQTQKQLIGTGDEPGPMFQHEALLWRPEDLGERDEDATKPISVRELQAWVDKHVRFDIEDVDPMLFPDTAEVLDQAGQAEEKIIPITFDHYVPPEARLGRTWGPRSWKRADGTKKAKACEHAVTGIVVIGPGRGDTFKVCVAKEKCKTHWGAEQRAKAKRQAGGEAKKAKDHREREEARWKVQQEKEEAQRARWRKGTPAILEAVAAVVRKAPLNSTGPLVRIILERIRPYGLSKKRAEVVPIGSTADDLLRHAAWLIISDVASNDWRGPRDFPKTAKALGIDVGKILKAAAPEEMQTSAKSPKRRKGKAAAAAAPAKGARKNAARKPRRTPAKKKVQATVFVKEGADATGAGDKSSGPDGQDLCALHPPAKPRTRKARGRKPSVPAGTRVAGDETMALVAATEPVACRQCGCTEADCHQCVEKTGEPCHWVEPDLCSACA